MSPSPREAAREAVRAARAAGADTADALAVERRQVRLTVRRGELETSREAETRGVGIRAFLGGRLGIAHTTDVSPAGIRRAAEAAAGLARVAGVDRAAGLPDPAHRAAPGPGFGGDDPAWESFRPEHGLEAARAAEAAAFAEDPRVSNSEGATFAASRGRVALAASDGFEGEYPRTSFRLLVVVVAGEGDGVLQRDGWWTESTLLARLEDPASVGRTAARRCVRRLGWSKVGTADVPVVLSPEVAVSLASAVAQSCCGDALVRRASFLADSLGKAVASPRFTLVDDPTIPDGIASRPFDAEGARTRRKAILEKGVLRNLLLDSWSLRKLGLAGDAAVPGNAVRGLGSPSGAGFTNLYVEPGEETPEQVLAPVESGFYVTETMGFGVNTTTGVYSQGAAGLWIDKGRLGRAAQEVTIAGDLRKMLLGVEAVGNDLEFRGEVAAPTIRIARMTVSGA